MILDAKKVFELLDGYEKDALEKHMAGVLSVADKDVRDRQTTIAAVEVRTIREIRDRLCAPEIKA
jgi:hypothetical protein